MAEFNYTAFPIPAIPITESGFMATLLSQIASDYAKKVDTYTKQEVNSLVAGATPPRITNAQIDAIVG